MSMCICSLRMLNVLVDTQQRFFLSIVHRADQEKDVVYILRSSVYSAYDDKNRGGFVVYQIQHLRPQIHPPDESLRVA